jgi:hypothetical protein
MNVAYRLEVERRQGVREIARRLLDEYRVAKANPGDAAIHEAAHECVASLHGFRDVAAFLRPSGGDLDGVCYFAKPPARESLDLIRSLAAVDMAGVAAEHMLNGRDVPGHEELLAAEGTGTYGQLEEVYRQAVAAFDGDGDEACEWLQAALPGVRTRTLRLLKENWPGLVRRAHELEGRAA